MVRVAEIARSLQTGGIETWLKDVASRYDRTKMQIDFVLLSDESGPYDRIVEQAGSRILRAPLGKGFLRSSLQLCRILKKGRYDVVHAHPHFYTGWICFIAFLAGVRLRISHSHSDTSRLDKKAGFGRRCYLAIQRSLIRLFATHRIACSQKAGTALFGKKTHEILFCGIDLERFIKTGDGSRDELLQSLGIPSGSFVIGHVGRLFPVKNHDFLIDVFAEVSRREPHAYLLLVGDGELQSGLEEKARRLGVRNVRFLGNRSDVDVLMKNVFDLFVLPSLHEGLPIVLIEAQTAGLQCLITDTFSPECVIIRENMTELPLQQEAWVSALQKAARQQTQVNYTEIGERMRRSPFSIEYSVRHLERIYSEKS